MTHTVTLQWVPEAERAPRSVWNSLRKVPFGWCRLCGDPIIVGAKGDCHSLADMAAGCKHVKQRHWHSECSRVFDQCVPKRWAVDRYYGGSHCALCDRDLLAIERRISAMRLRHYRDWRRLRRLVRVVAGMGIHPEPGRMVGEADHIIPLWAGGQNHPSNYQLLCHRCHKAKTKREARLRAIAKAEWKVAA